ncbi:hypothetical protein TRIUR3_34387 [Triticum urartu]|uniref:Uncharacterized protein n=1 Tax=Triticum urartu TaxID=4572 RepID=M7ZQS3_TRIUA|nr:hypothetical protein TRIUR3_34387 [Triticum urartu]
MGILAISIGSGREATRALSDSNGSAGDLVEVWAEVEVAGSNEQQFRPNWRRPGSWASRSGQQEKEDSALVVVLACSHAEAGKRRDAEDGEGTWGSGKTTVGRQKQQKRSGMRNPWRRRRDPADLGGDEASLWRSRGAGTRRASASVEAGRDDGYDCSPKEGRGTWR